MVRRRCSHEAGAAAINLRFHMLDRTGTIPSELGKLSKLSKLRLNLNTLTGRLPSELAQCEPFSTEDYKL